MTNYRCFPKCTCELKPFNVLVGPNDTGKSAFLDGIFRLHSFDARNLAPGMSIEMPRGNSISLNPVARLGAIDKNDFWHQDLSSGMTIDFEVSWTSGSCQMTLTTNRKVMEKGMIGVKSGTVLPPNDAERPNWASELEAAISVSLYRLTPSILRMPSEVKLSEMSRDGGGLPTFLANLLLQDRKAFFRMEEVFYRLFPSYKSILIGKDGHGRNYSISFISAEGDELPCTSVSDGVMLSLAYLAISHDPHRPSLLLLEEPETGIHHANLEVLVRVLREEVAGSGSQVILTTHSPYLVDHADPEEVLVFSKDSEGACHIKPFSEFSAVERRRKHFLTGEIWANLDEDELPQGEDAR